MWPYAAPCLALPHTSQIVESKSTVISAAGAAPTDHARICADSRALSSWRTCPNLNDRKNDPTVDGAITRNGSTACDAAARRRPVSSMQRPPTSIDATKVNTLRPAPEPAEPGGRTVSSISDSSPRRSITVPASNNPASATKEASSNTASNPSIPPAMLLTGSASSRSWNNCRY